MKFDGLIALEPRLGELLQEARQAGAAEAEFCADAAWCGYGGHPRFKRAVSELVGWNRADGDLALRSSNKMSCGDGRSRASIRRG
jgi:hypothetical protein